VSATSEFEVRELDKSLAADGEDIELQRLIGTQLIPIKVTCRAFVRGYAAVDLIASIVQRQRKVIMSPTQIIRAGWPGPNSSATPTNQDRRVPRKGDRAIIDGGLCTVEEAGGINIDSELIRIEMRVLG
jgi:hypothetical protein